MLFNSFEFFIFLPVVFATYWSFRNIRFQNAFLLAASYFFYGYWDYRFLSLLLLSTVIDYVLGWRISLTSDKQKKKVLLIGSLVTNLGLLGFFKYYNFFADSFLVAAKSLGWSPDVVTLSIVLPVGISFYTFQTLSYTIDVYRGNIKAEHNFINFAAFVTFFPQLVAGPIERASNLLPQFSRQRVFRFDLAINGVQQIIWGLFKKVVIADNAAVIVNTVFGSYTEYGAVDLWIGLFLFSFQIYCDFSGYSDIAIGVAKLFGFTLMTNFRFPYLAKNVAEFWRRWHISLSTWFRDYIYMPLGGSKVSNGRAFRNIFIVFMVSGLWHGANWTFIVWGFIHAMLYLPLYLRKQNRPVLQAENLLQFKNVILVVSNFLIVTLAWLFFRSPTISDAVHYGLGLFVKWGGGSVMISNLHFSIAAACISLLMLSEIIFHNQPFPFIRRGSTRVGNFILYASLVVLIVLMGYQGTDSSFIYFQF